MYPWLSFPDLEKHPQRRESLLCFHFSQAHSAVPVLILPFFSSLSSQVDLRSKIPDKPSDIPDSLLSGKVFISQIFKVGSSSCLIAQILGLPFCRGRELTPFSLLPLLRSPTQDSKPSDATIAKRRQSLEALENSIQTRYGLEGSHFHVNIFGSTAYGLDTDTTDLDICIVVSCLTFPSQARDRSRDEC